MVTQEENTPKKHGGTEAKEYFPFCSTQWIGLVGLFWGMFISSSWEKCQLKFH